MNICLETVNEDPGQPLAICTKIGEYTLEKHTGEGGGVGVRNAAAARSCGLRPSFCRSDALFLCWTIYLFARR